MSKNFVIITSIGLMGLIFGLFGCQKHPNSVQICKNNPELCADLHEDSWCKDEKESLIQHRYHLLSVEKPEGKDLYLLLRKLEDYSQCLNLASNIKHVINTHRTQERERAYIVSTQTLAQLQQYTKNDTNVYLAYYRWLRFNDAPSRKIVITAYRNKQIHDPEMMASLATYYTRLKPNDAKKLYLQLLLLDDPDNFDPDWLLGLASVFKQQQKLQLVYILTKANILMTKRSANQRQLLNLVNGDKKFANKLNNKSQKLVVALQGGEFSKSDFASQLKSI